MSTENLFNQEARKKLKELAEDARVCMMSTLLDKRPIPTRPMTVQHVCEETGKLFFLSSKGSNKNYEIKDDSEIQITFSNKGNSEYLSIYGTAKIHTDRATIDEHWSTMANAWFNGKEDPEVSVISVEPKDVRYWDTKNGKWVDMALMAYAAMVDGKTFDEGVKGNLEV